MNLPRVPSRHGPSRGPTPVVSLIARFLLGAAVLVVCVLVVWWWAIGGRWFIVRTASMGTYAPVGTLLWVKPTPIRDVRVGDVITFHTPSVGGVPRQAHGLTNPPVKVRSQIYTHRVVAVDRDGTVQTKGDLDGARDPWHIDQRHLVGRVAAALPGLGWLVKAYPVLLPGVVALWVLTRLLASERSRAPLRVVGAAILVAVAIYVYNPLFGATQLSFVPLGRPGARATYVGTGLLPVKLQALDVPPVLVHTGQERSIVATHLSLHGRYQVHVAPVVPWQTWAIIIGASLAPAVWSVIVGVPPPPPPRGGRKGRTSGPAPTTPELQPS